MNEVKKLIKYDMQRVLSRVKKEYGKIKRGTEEFYDPQLNYIEHTIYEIWEENPITDYELQDAICAVIYDLKGYVENKTYDYSEVLDERVVKFSRKLQHLFNPFVNDEIKVNDLGKNDLKGLFTLPIICLDRIYYSVDFWRDRYGKNGYYKMLEEMVLPIFAVGEFPFALDVKYLK